MKTTGEDSEFQGLSMETIGKDYCTRGSLIQHRQWRNKKTANYSLRQPDMWKYIWTVIKRNA